MKTIIANALLFFAPALLPQRTVIAVERPAASGPALRLQLVRKQPGESGGICLVRHVQSFIDGLVVTGERVTLRDHYPCNCAD